MALSSFLMQELIKRVRPGQRIASMGYPDIIATPDEVSAIVGNVSLKYLDKAVSKRHGVSYLLPDAQDFFKSLDIELDVYDVVKERGCEILCDLNNEKEFIHISEYAPYDVVIDVGTMEHCFNIGQALMNMASLVKLNGYIIHENPFLAGNHGFYCINPTLYTDFYEQNGFEIEMVKLADMHGGTYIHDAPRTKRFQISSPQELSCIAVAKRKVIKEFTFPNQSKYKKLIEGEAK